MVEEQQFCLRWNNFQVNITSQFETLRDEEDFVDVTLACEGQRLKAHKVVLSACSPYFKDLFKSNPCKHPILFMRDVEFRHLKSLVEFMYAGEVNVAQAQLSAFLRTAESLQIRGLTEAPQRHKQLENLSTQGPTTSVTQLGAPSHSGSSRPHSASPGDGAHTTASSPEADHDDDEVLSLSPPSSPSPAKRVCRDRGERSERVDQTEPHEDTSTQHTHSQPTEQLDVIKNESPEIVEPKMEVPDYSSDGESRTDSGAMSGTFLGLDNSVDMNASFAGLHGGMEILPGTSAQSFMGETSQDSTQGTRHGRSRRLPEWRPFPAPRREDSPLNLAGGGAMGSSNGVVSLCEGVAVSEAQLRKVNWGDYRKMTRGLAAILFSPLELATCSVTGQRWSRAGLAGGRPIKPALDRDKVQAILAYVTARFPTVEVTKVKQVLAYKCKESASSLKVKGAQLLVEQQQQQQYQPHEDH